MKRSVFQHITVFLMSFCFLTGALGFTYSDCPMAGPEQQAVQDAMDCHEQGTSKPSTQKKCCDNMSCLKCFSSYSMKWASVDTSLVRDTRVPGQTQRLLSYLHILPERPPKMA